MPRKIKFALEMADGTKVRNNLEELRQHFDIESIVSYFLSGKLQEWLEDRYYEEEAYRVAELDRDSNMLNVQLCEIIGVEYTDSAVVDVEAIEKVNAKKSILRQKTSDSSIIDNAAITAFSQEDLADLLDNNEPVIYLLGDKFNIPIRISNKKYIGILGKPAIKIHANSQADLDDKHIEFENVILPWTPKAAETIIPSIVSTPTPIHTTSNQPRDTPSPSATDDDSDTEDMIDAFTEVYNSSFGCYKKNQLWEVATLSNCDSNEELSPAKKKIALRLICKGHYQEKDLIHIKVAEDLSAGYALTKDSICFGGNFGNIIVPYKDIDTNGEPISVSTKFNGTFSFDEVYTYILHTYSGEFVLASAVEHKGLDILHGDTYSLNPYLKTAANLAISLG